jgi:hypothetical protein
MVFLANAMGKQVDEENGHTLRLEAMLAKPAGQAGAIEDPLQQGQFDRLDRMMEAYEV